MDRQQIPLKVTEVHFARAVRDLAGCPAATTSPTRASRYRTGPHLGETPALPAVFGRLTGRSTFRMGRGLRPLVRHLDSYQFENSAAVLGKLHTSYRILSSDEA